LPKANFFIAVVAVGSEIMKGGGEGQKKKTERCLGSYVALLYVDREVVVVDEDGIVIVYSLVVTCKRLVREFVGEE
jgi:hypothetical protein